MTLVFTLGSIVIIFGITFFRTRVRRRFLFQGSANALSESVEIWRNRHGTVRNVYRWITGKYRYQTNRYPYIYTI